MSFPLSCSFLTEDIRGNTQNSGDDNIKITGSFNMTIGAFNNRSFNYRAIRNGDLVVLQIDFLSNTIDNSTISMSTGAGALPAELRPVFITNNSVSLVSSGLTETSRELYRTDVFSDGTITITKQAGNTFLSGQLFTYYTATLTYIR